MTDEIPVIGASASGLLTALLLARGGRRVRVFERARDLSPARRTLIVTDRMRHYLGALGDGAVVNQINKFELYANGCVADVSLRRPDLVVERSSLIRELAKQAEHAGAKMDLGKRFTGLRRGANGLEVELRADGDVTDTVAATTVVGADGAASRVARAAEWPDQRLVPLLQAIVPLPAGMSPNTTRIWFRPEETPFFYWLIPESQERGALGVIGTRADEIRTYLDGFMAAHDLAPLEYQSARIPLFTGWTPVRRRLGRGEVFLVGDAAAQVKVTTVGGLVTGFRGAVGVAQAILGGGSSPELRRLRRELGTHHLIRKAIHPFAQNDYVRMLELLNAAAQRSLASGSRDEASRFALRLALAQPRLLLLLLRGLLQHSLGRGPAA